MIGSYLPAALSRKRSLPRFLYQSVADNDSHLQLEDEKLSTEVPAADKPRWRAWLFACLILIAITVPAVFGCRYLLGSGKKKTESFVPDLKTYPTAFEKNSTFAGPPSEQSNAAWDSLIPDGHGYVLIPGAADKFGLKPGISTEEGADRYSVAIYHQLHCLGVIRILFYGMADRLHLPTSAEKRQHEHSSPGHESDSHDPHSKDHNPYHDKDRQDEIQDPLPDHVEHCFDYVRQSLMCAGDMTIEHAREPPLGEKRSTTDGWGVVHQCKDWNEMVGWTLNHKAKHPLSGILG